MATTVRPTTTARKSTSTDVQKLLELIKQKNIQVVDVKFCDLPGTWQHFSIPAATLDEAMIREGLGFAGSPIRGFQAFKAEEYLKTTGIATTSCWGPEAEFFIFNSVRFDQNAHEGYYHIDSEEGIWNSGTNGTANLGHRPRHKEGYFPCPPTDRLQDLRSKIMLAMIAAGIEVEVHH